MINLQTGYKIKNYEVLSTLGVGGTGIVYLCQDTILRKNVVLKEILPSSLAYRTDSSNKVYARKEKYKDFIKLIESIKRKIKEIVKLDHPNIPKIYQLFEENNTLYIVMEYCEGDTLDVILKDTNTEVTEEEIKHIYLPLMDALEYIHNNNIIHKDIKISNIFICSINNKPLLLDFESSRITNSIRDFSEIILTPGYAPPEQYSLNDEVGAWTDIYSLGCSIYKTMFPTISLPTSTERLVALSSGEEDPFLPAIKLGRELYSHSLLSIVDWMTKLQIKNRPENISIIINLIKNGKSAPLSKENEGESTIFFNIPNIKIDPYDNNRTIIFSPTEKVKRVEVDRKNKENLFFQVISIIGGVVLSSSILNILIDTPSVVISTISYSFGAIIGLLFSRGKY